MNYRRSSQLDGFPLEELALLDEVEEEWREEMIPESIRRKALERGYVRKALNSDDDVVWLAEMITAMEEGARPLSRSGKSEQTLEPDRNLSALAEIMASDARISDAVRGFRRVALRGKLIKPHRVRHWIESRAGKEGSATQFVDLPITAERIPQTRRDMEPGMKWSQRLLPYEIGTGDVYFVPVVNGGYLDGLRNIADRQSERYGWHRAYVARFVLSDEVPPIERARWTVRVKRPFAAAGRITMDVSQRATPDEVRKLFVHARAELDAGRVRSISEKHATLAVFAFERRDGWRWRDAMDEWNLRFPEWSYRAMEQFSRDAHKAYRRVTGDRLLWGSS